MSGPRELFVISVDVGTTCVRLAIIAFHGEDFRQAKVIASYDKDIDHFQDGDKYEQNSRQIFAAICECSKACIQKANIEPASIRSIGFSATCSLVIHNETDQSNDVIMWMDHRAIEEARSITLSEANVLEQFGGVCSPEFSLSKLAWLKNNASERLKAASGLFELPDWLVYRCIGGDASECPRSLCSLTCKWGYNAESGCHCDIMETLFDSQMMREKFGSTVLKPGTVAGYMSLSSALELGLVDASMGGSGDPRGDGRTRTDIVVGTSLIDAHAGMLAMLSIPMNDHGNNLAIETTLGSLAGTSSCHMLLSKDYNFTKGIWGPYKNVILDDYYLLEAGQTLTGKLVEICIEQSQEGKRLLDSGMSMKAIIQDLNKQIDSKEPRSDLHVLPTYHGNRSPTANPRLRGGIYGLSMRASSLLNIYIAHVEAIAFETRLIVETLGIQLSCILVSGGLMKNKFYMQTLANVLNCRAVKISLQGVDLMVMGSALVARCAAINSMRSTSVREIIPKTDQQPLTHQNIKDLIYEQLDVETFEPLSSQRKYLEQKYSCYKEFVQFSQRVDEILNKDN